VQDTMISMLWTTG
nr:immunoglobulin heavy chain junction region [Mus musculus]